ncbi:MAG: hypothetical protein NC301_01175 [Bacteroides sp.]|nr:hypothetical protein [Bacteroides sp.]MCM1378777.1 hypothetical protein [Bacteroides sp.]MCM1445394.1 hypothetical protein [Prevotella sp.]
MALLLLPTAAIIYHSPKFVALLFGGISLSSCGDDEPETSFIPALSLSAETMSEFLMERYFPFKSGGSDFYFFSPNQNTLVLLSVTILNREVVYFITYGSGSSSRSVNEFNFEGFDFDNVESKEVKAVASIINELFK